jgi:hypothetical protein
MCTTSSSPRKRRTTASSRRAAAAVAVAVLVVAVACAGRRREPFVTYFNGDHGVSLRHPPGWRGDQREQGGVWYRYFVPPPSGAPRSPVSVTLLAGPMAVPLETYAQSYLAGNKVASSQPEERQGVPGRSWVYSSPDGKTGYRLLLLAQSGQVLGLYSQGDAEAFAKDAPAIDEMFSSLTVERPDLYPVTEFKGQQASLGLPPSWRETRRFSGGGTLVVNYVSPPLAVDSNGQAVHASLAVTFEAVPGGGGLDQYYAATRQRLGDNFQVRSHASFKGGYVDIMHTETPVQASFVKRYYFAHAGRGCSLSFEAREDIFPRTSRWADYIASTLRFGAPGEAAK